MKCKRDIIPHKAKGLCKTCYEASKGYIWQRNYNDANRGKLNQYNKNYVLRNGTFTKRWIKKIAERDGMYCRECKSTDNLTLQHKIPKSIGGKYSYENLEILCFSCNIKAWDTLIKKALKTYFKSDDIVRTL
jgi:5-methylcytosine-specific restriction endonuclease McrA